MSVPFFAYFAKGCSFSDRSEESWVLCKGAMDRKLMRAMQNGSSACANGISVSIPNEDIGFLLSASTGPLL